MRATRRRADYPVSDKVVLITGAGRGLGAATAHELTSRGARVVVADIDPVSARRTAASLPAGTSLPVVCDVTDNESTRAAVGSARKHFGGIDVVIANAGVLGGGGTLRTSPASNAALVMDVNVNGALNTVTSAIDDVIDRRGQFVVISSVFAYLNGAGVIPYAMSKAAVEQLARGLGTELAPHGVSVMTAYFSLIQTELVKQGIDADPHLVELLASYPSVMLKRIEPEVAATAIVDGIESRATRVTVPERWRPMNALRGVLGPLLDARSLTDPAIQRALALLAGNETRGPDKRPDIQPYPSGS